MQDNLNKASQRGDRLDALQDKTDNLATSAQGFRRGANRVRKQMWWKDMKMRICIIVGIIILLIIIIVPSGKSAVGAISSLRGEWRLTQLPAQSSLRRANKRAHNDILCTTPNRGRTCRRLSRGQHVAHGSRPRSGYREAPAHPPSHTMTFLPFSDRETS